MPPLHLILSQASLALIQTITVFTIVNRQYFIKWVTSHNFVKYLPPKDEQLVKYFRSKEIDKKLEKKRRRRGQAPKHQALEHRGDKFEIGSKIADFVKLDKSTLKENEMLTNPYAIQMEWVMTLFYLTCFSFILSELQYHYVESAREYNCGLIWPSLVFLYSVGRMMQMLFLYLRVGDGSLMGLSCTSFLFIALLTLAVDEEILEFEIEKAPWVEAKSIINQSSSKSRLKKIIFAIKISTALMSMLYGLLFTFCGVKTGKLHYDLTKKGENNTRQQRWGYRANFFSPLIISCLWVKPIARRLIPVDDISFDVIKIYCILIGCFIRFYYLTDYVQVYLMGAPNRLKRLRHRLPVTTNARMQITVDGLNHFTFLAVQQYAMPIVLCFFMTLMYSTQCGHHWIPFYSPSIETYYNATTTTTISPVTEEYVEKSFIMGTVLGPNYPRRPFFSAFTLDSMAQFWNFLNSGVLKGVFSYWLWWMHFSWFLSMTMGVGFHMYVDY